jgi:hypothetical protein
MPACPYGNHRLVIGSNAACERRGNDLRVYAALEQMPLAFYNRARRLWDAGDLRGRLPGYRPRCISVGRSLPEAYWLLAAIESKKGNLDRGRHYLTVAKQLRAPADPEWLDSPPGPHPSSLDDEDVHPSSDRS